MNKRKAKKRNKKLYRFFHTVDDCYDYNERRKRLRMAHEEFVKNKRKMRRRIGFVKQYPSRPRNIWRRYN